MWVRSVSLRRLQVSSCSHVLTCMFTSECFLVSTRSIAKRCLVSNLSMQGNDLVLSILSELSTHSYQCLPAPRAFPYLCLPPTVTDF